MISTVSWCRFPAFTEISHLWGWSLLYFYNFTAFKKPPNQSNYVTKILEPMAKIVLLASEFPPQPGGIGNHAYHLASGLQANGFDVKLVCDIRSGNGQEEEQFDKTVSFEVVRIPRRKFILRSYLDRISKAYSLTEKCDVVISSGKFSLWLGAFLRLFFNRKFVAIIHGTEISLPNKILRKVTDKSLKRFDTVIAVSNFTATLVSHLNLKQIIVIPNGFQMMPLASGNSQVNPSPVLITVGNVTERKGQHNVINTLPTLLRKFPDLKYHIVGIPTDRSKLEKLALNIEVNDSIVFHGKVSERQKSELLQQSNVFVMLSESTKEGDVEGFGIAILEANSLGVPAIGSLGCGIEDAIKDGYSGRLIDNKNPQQFEAALVDILDNYTTYSPQAKAWSGNFTWERIIKEYLKILQ